MVKAAPPAGSNVFDAVEDTATGTIRGEPGAAEQALDLERGAQVGRYVIVDRIGAGGMGVVYAAYDWHLDRKVALKFLGPGRIQPRGVRRLRLLREAQAMARLSHPNAVAIYEVGAAEGQVFIAMEYVDGVDVRRWLAEGGRRQSEILDVFCAAGRGLAAAHAAGIVHRDFKPANVLIDRQNRARVTDFGLSRAVPSASSTDPGDDSIDRWTDGAGEEPDLPAANLLGAPLTQTGELRGTPRYMSPEQRRGLPPDARGDQFSFCVALYEALYLEHPFRAETAIESLARLLEGKVNPPPAGTRVPRWCRSALLRGLRARPEERYPSMDALLAELSARRAPRRGAMAVAGAIALFAAGAAANALLVPGPAPGGVPSCDDGERRLAGVWDADRQRAVRAAFTASAAPHAQLSWDLFARSLDRRADAWVEMADEACTATHRRRVQSPAALDLRTACLDRKLREMGALVDIYSERLDGAALDRSLAAVDGLSSIAECADVAGLSGVAAPPDDPSVRARIADLQGRLGRARALFDAGRFDEARADAAGLAKEAATLGYAPLAAEIANELGQNLFRLGRHAEARAALLEATEQATAGRAWNVEAEAWASLVINSARQSRVAEALMAGHIAELSVERANGDAALRGSVAMAIGNAHFEASNLQQALAHYQRAVELWTRALGPDSPRLAGALGNAGNVLVLLGRLREGAPYLERALEARRELRPDHPDIAYSTAALGELHLRLGHYRRARDLYQTGAAIREKELGRQHPLSLVTLEYVALTDSYLGHHDSALPLLRELVEIGEKVLAPGDRDLATLHLVLGDAEWRAGRDQPAERAIRRSIALYDRIETKSLSAGVARMILGQLHNDHGSHGRALAECRRGLEILTAELTDANAEVRLARGCIGEALIGMGDSQAARRELERALGAVSEQDSAPAENAALRFQLARALWAEPSERTKARLLARDALAALRAAEGDQAAAVARVEAWLRARPESQAG